MYLTELNLILATLDDLLIDLEKDKADSKRTEAFIGLPEFYRTFHTGVTQGIVAAITRVKAMQEQLSSGG